MNRAGVTVLLCVLGLSLTGCGNSMRGYLEKETPTQTLSARQDLTMPPDLRLPPPGTTAAAPDPGVASAPATQTAALTTPPSSAPAAPAYTAPKAAAPAVTTGTTTAGGDPKDAIYTNVGISVYNPDGTRKSDLQLREELQAYYIAQKKSKNPNYGTFMNIGNIFKDE